MKSQRLGVGLLVIMLASFCRPWAHPVVVPALAGATIQVSVRFSSQLQAFYYTYDITNSSKSVGYIDDFEVDITRPSGAKILDRSGLSDNTAAYEGGNFSEHIWENLGTKVIPVAFISSGDSGWKGGPSMFQSADFAYLSLSSKLLSPGATFRGLEIASHGLVGIRKYHVQAAYDANALVSTPIDEIPPGPNQDSQVSQTLAQYGENLDKVNLIGNTLAPTALPQNCDPACMVQFLASEKEQAFQLGWITNAGVANSLDAKLNEAQKKLQAGDTQVAIHILKSFILDLEAQHQGQTGQGGGASKGNAQTSGKHVTDNAYYLLKPNAEFILDKLGATSIP